MSAAEPLHGGAVNITAAPGEQGRDSDWYRLMVNAQRLIHSHREIRGACRASNAPGYLGIGVCLAPQSAQRCQMESRQVVKRST